MAGMQEVPLNPKTLVVDTVLGTITGAGAGALYRPSLQRPGLAYELKYLDRHLPGTKDAARILRKDGAAHLFTDKATLSQVEAAILERGRYTGSVRGTDRYGLQFENPIGYRLAQDRSRVPLHYGEIKIRPDGRYHLAPRTRSAK
jgi:hypothetical protein